MTSRELTSVGLALLGITVGLRSLTLLANSFTFSQTFPSGGDIMIVAVAAVVLSVIPAVIIVLNRDRWAARLFPESSPSTPPESSTLYATGLLLLGIYFVVSGAASTAIVLPAVLFWAVGTESPSGVIGWTGVARGTVLAIAGVVIILRGRSLARA